MLGEPDNGREDRNAGGATVTARAPLELCTAVGLLSDQGEWVNWWRRLWGNFSVLLEPVLVLLDVLSRLVLRHPGVKLRGRPARRGMTWGGKGTG